MKYSCTRLHHNGCIDTNFFVRLYTSPLTLLHRKVYFFVPNFVFKLLNFFHLFHFPSFTQLIPPSSQYYPHYFLSVSYFPLIVSILLISPDINTLIGSHLCPKPPHHTVPNPHPIVLRHFFLPFRSQHSLDYHNVYPIIS